MNKSDYGCAKYNRLELTFDSLRREGEKALIPFITAGDPDLETTRRLALHILEQEGDILELGVPCSDALADGPVIQRASRRALEAGTTPDKIFQLVSRIRQKTGKPLVLLVYYNQVLQRGKINFLDDMKKAGADGLIVPDLPLEESASLREAARERNLSFITMAAPTLPEERCRQAAEAGSGFLYCVSVAGVTGTRTGIPEETLSMLQKLRQFTSLPLALGFGISSRQQISAVAPYVDGVIVGSSLMEGLEGKSTADKLNFASSFLLKLKGGFSGSF